MSGPILHKPSHPAFTSTGREEKLFPSPLCQEFIKISIGCVKAFSVRSYSLMVQVAWVSRFKCIAFTCCCLTSSLAAVGHRSLDSMQCGSLFHHLSKLRNNLILLLVLFDHCWFHHCCLLKELVECQTYFWS